MDPVVKWLRRVFFGYLAFLPAWAFASGLWLTDRLGGVDNASPWLLFGLFFAVVVYLGVALEIIPFPDTRIQAVSAVFTVPLQLALFAWLNQGTVADFLIIGWTVEMVALFVVLLIQGFRRQGAKVISPIGIVIIGLLVLYPAYSMWSLIMLTGVYAGWAAWVGLGVGAITRVFERTRNLTGAHRQANANSNIGWVLVGVFSFIAAPLWLKLL